MTSALRIAVLSAAISGAAACGGRVLSESPTNGSQGSGGDRAPKLDAAADAMNAAPTCEASNAPCATSFEKSVVPILNEHCYGCHSGGSNPILKLPDMPSGPGYYAALRDTRFWRDQRPGRYLNVCSPEESTILCNLRVDGHETCGVWMPPGPAKLPAADLETIASWVACGAPNN